MTTSGPFGNATATADPGPTPRLGELVRQRTSRGARFARGDAAVDREQQSLVVGEGMLHQQRCEQRVGHGGTVPPNPQDATGVSRPAITRFDDAGLQVGAVISLRPASRGARRRCRLRARGRSTRSAPGVRLSRGAGAGMCSVPSSGSSTTAMLDRAWTCASASRLSTSFTMVTGMRAATSASTTDVRRPSSRPTPRPCRRARRRSRCARWRCRTSRARHRCRRP